MTSPAARTALDIADWRRRVFALYEAVRDADDPEDAHELWRIERDALFRSSRPRKRRSSP
ncbi:MAG: hypothetical protein K0R81_3187 [Microbacterium sp.]|nr:hypothetical protein [Microbacterium sp.]